MKGTKRLICLALCLCMLGSWLPFAAQAANAGGTARNEWISGETIKAKKTGATSFNIRGLDGKKDYQTTYRNGGYHTAVSVDGGSKQREPKNTIASGLQLDVDLEKYSDTYIKVQYTLKNTGAKAHTVRVAGYADVMIDNNDRAPICATEDGGAIIDGNGNRATRTMAKSSSYTIDRALYSTEQSRVNIAKTASGENGAKIADTTTSQGGSTQKIHFLLNRDNKENYHTSSNLSSYFSGNTLSYLQNTCTNWLYRYEMYAYEQEDCYEHAYMGSKPAAKQHYDLSGKDKAVSGIDGQLWACNFLQTEGQTHKQYCFPDQRTGGKEGSGYPLDANGSTTEINGKRYVTPGVNDPCYLYFSAAGANEDIWRTNGLYTFTLTFNGETVTRQAAVSKLDTMAPAITVSQLPGDVYAEQVTLEISVTDGGSGVKTVTAKWGETTAVLTEHGDGTYSATCPNAAGAYKLTVTAADNVGNSASAESKTYTVDLQKPILTVRKTSSGTAGETYAYTVNANGNRDVTVRLPDGTETSALTGSFTLAEPETYLVIVTDAAGHFVSQEITVSAAVDGIAPDVRLYADDTVDSSELTVSAAIYEAGSAPTVLLDGAALTVADQGDGLYTGSFPVTCGGCYTVAASDRAGNTGRDSITVYGLVYGGRRRGRGKNRRGDRVKLHGICPLDAHRPRRRHGHLSGAGGLRGLRRRIWRPFRPCARSPMVKG